MPRADGTGPARCMSRPRSPAAALAHRSSSTWIPKSLRRSAARSFGAVNATATVLIILMSKKKGSINMSNDPRFVGFDAPDDGLGRAIQAEAELTRAALEAR